MKTFDEIKNILRQNKEILAEKFNVGEISIFGSYARNEQNKESDIDILIDFNKSIGLLKFIELERYLSNLLGIKVEIVTRRALKPHIGKHILQELVRV